MNITLKPVSKMGLFCLLIPFLLCGYIVYDGATKVSGTEYRFAIEGFDPRDPLRGHYMIFRYVWPEPKPKCTIGDCALCVSGDPVKPTVSVFSPSKPCEAKWDMGYSPVTVQAEPQPDINQSQYYIPELEAPILEQMLMDRPKDFSVGVVITNGVARVKTLYINNLPLKTYLKP
jgi:GDYXXLXY protein